MESSLMKFGSSSATRPSVSASASCYRPPQSSSPSARSPPPSSLATPSSPSPLQNKLTCAKMEAHQYRPLDTSRNEIRLLSVFHGDASMAVRCSLPHYPLLSSPDYVALSYAWREKVTLEGEIGGKEKILVENREFLVTKNLALALQTLRAETGLMWVDALCIDQSNNTERSAQVSIMRKIYERAKKVVVWLGPDKDESSLAMGFLEVMAEHAVKPNFSTWLMDTCEGGRHRREWAALQKLFDRAWWTRTWAVQEFVLGKEVVFVCGQRSMAAKTLEQATREVYHYGLSLCKILLDRHAIKLNVMTLRNMIRLMSLRQWREEGKPLTLLPILDVVNWTSCFDPRDKVYGILGIVADPDIASITPDYTSPPHEIYRALVMHNIKSHRSLGILGFVKPSNTIQGLPGWVPDWSVTSVSMPLAPMFREASNKMTDYCAAKSIAAIISFSPDSSILNSRGVLIDGIDGTSLAVVPESPLETSEVLAISSANAYGEEVDVFDALWRLFVGNASYPNHPDIQAPLSFRPIVIKKCLAAEERSRRASKQSTPEQRLAVPVSDDSLETWYRLVRGFKIAGRCVSDILFDHGTPYATAAASDPPVSAHTSLAFEQSIQIMRSGRRLITTTKGYLGLAPSGVKRGDKVCVLLGCDVPLILRPVGDEDDGQFRVIGDAYVHGMMHGEAIEGVESLIYTLRDFNLC